MVELVRSRLNEECCRCVSRLIWLSFGSAHLVQLDAVSRAARLRLVTGAAHVAFAARARRRLLAVLVSLAAHALVAASSNPISLCHSSPTEGSSPVLDTSERIPLALAQLRALERRVVAVI